MILNILKTHSQPNLFKTFERKTYFSLGAHEFFSQFPINRIYSNEQLLLLVAPTQISFSLFVFSGISSTPTKLDTLVQYSSTQ